MILFTLNLYLFAIIFLQNIIANRMFKHIDQYFIHYFWHSCLNLRCAKHERCTQSLINLLKTELLLIPHTAEKVNFTHRLGINYSYSYLRLSGMLLGYVSSIWGEFGNLTSSPLHSYLLNMTSTNSPWGVGGTLWEFKRSCAC